MYRTGICLSNSQQWQARNAEYIALVGHIAVLINCHQTPVQSGSTAPELAISTSRVGSPACSACGLIKVSGKLSCCARGGAWFKRCGDDGDTKVEHTWLEGIEACRSKLTRELPYMCSDEDGLMNVIAVFTIIVVVVNLRSFHGMSVAFISYECPCSQHHPRLLKVYHWLEALRSVLRVPK